MELIIIKRADCPCRVITIGLSEDYDVSGLQLIFYARSVFTDGLLKTNLKSHQKVYDLAESEGY
jgi:hypothetical protein